jgi:hypothetical protein
MEPCALSQAIKRSSRSSALATAEALGGVCT